MEKRIFKKCSVLGTIEKELDYSVFLVTKNIHLFCTIRGKREYLGTIPRYKEDALISEWEQAGFAEVV